MNHFCESRNGPNGGLLRWNFQRVEAYDYTRVSLGFSGHLRRQHVYFFLVSAAAYTLHLLGLNQAIEYIYRDDLLFSRPESQ